MRKATKKSGSKNAPTKAKAPAKPGDPDLVPLTALDKEKGPAAKTKGRKTKTPKAAKPKALSCLDGAAQVLKDKGEPMNCKGMIDAIFAAKLWHSDAPTPAATLSSAILREITKKGKDARFKKVDRGQFVFNG